MGPLTPLYFSCFPPRQSDTRCWKVRGTVVALLSGFCMFPGFMSGCSTQLKAISALAYGEKQEWKSRFLSYVEHEHRGLIRAYLTA